MKKKWSITILVSLYTFLSPLSSSAMAPTSDRIAAQFGISESNSTLKALLTSMFVAGYGEYSALHDSTAVVNVVATFCGPLMLGPLSEIFGRARVLQGANAWYLGKFRMSFEPSRTH